MKRINTSQLHQRLEDLALEAQQHAPGSYKRQIALTKLIRTLQASGKIYCHNKHKFPPEVYEEALQEAFLALCSKIDDYDRTQASILTCFNKLLGWRFLDASKRYIKHAQRCVSLDNPIGDTGIPFLDAIAQPVPTPKPYERLREYFDKDPDGLLSKRHVKGRPEANLRAIALGRLAGKSWKELSSKWGVTVPTLSSFYQRNCRHFANLIQAYFDDN